jgi:hypothetical protein
MKTKSVSEGSGWMADSQVVMVNALQGIGMTKRQSKLVIRFGVDDAEHIDRQCDLAAQRAESSNHEAEYMVCRVNRLDVVLQDATYEVVEYDELGNIDGDVTPIWSSSDGFDFDPDCVCF